MNAAYIEAKRQLAYDPPTHMSPGEWRSLVEGLVRQIEQDRVNVIHAIARSVEDRVTLVNNQDTGRIAGLNEVIDMLRGLAQTPA